MSVKFFPPSPDLAYNTQTACWWDDIFSEKEIKTICKIGESLPKQPSKVGGDKKDEIIHEIRSCTVSWIDQEGWIADKLEYVARQINGKYFGFDLWGFCEKFQFTVYKHKKEIDEHYDWHADNGKNLDYPRKLSMVLQLSDPKEYEGGQLQIWATNQVLNVPKKKGLITVFPSYILHRVTPTTKGTRKTLVVWISGPKFR